MFCFLDDKGNELHRVPATCDHDEVMLDAYGYCGIYQCDITITRNGNFYDRIKYRAVKVSGNAFAFDARNN